jgi:hypothetical protein
MEVYLEDSNGDQICFNHAVKAVMEVEETISIKGYDDSDCDQSGAWWIGGCKKCQEENDEEESIIDIEEYEDYEDDGRI